MIKFTIPGPPPRATAQMKKVRVVCGHPQFYMPDNVAQARDYLKAGVMRHAPSAPLEGAVELKVCWFFKAQRKKDDGVWKITRPDTDNLMKMLKDTMTEAGYWLDDAQVARETSMKAWAIEPGITIEVRRLDE